MMSGNGRSKCGPFFGGLSERRTSLRTPVGISYTVLYSSEWMAVDSSHVLSVVRGTSVDNQPLRSGGGQTHTRRPLADHSRRKAHIQGTMWSYY